jgi:hypothetical protein
MGSQLNASELLSYASCRISIERKNSIKGAQSMNDMELLRTVFARLGEQSKAEEARALELLKKQWSTHGRILDNSTLRLAAFRDQASLQRILSVHPARQTVIGLEGVRRSFNILDDSRRAFIEIAGRFHGRLLHGDSGDHAIGDVLRQATKEAYTYSVAASSLVQSYRHLVSSVPEIEEKYEQLKSEIFGNNGIVKFFSSLRNANNHDRIIVASPHFKITHGENKEVVSGIAFDKTEILGNSN